MYDIHKCLVFNQFRSATFEIGEVLESVMYEIRLKRRIATRGGKGNQPLNIKKAVDRPILKLG